MGKAKEKSSRSATPSQPASGDKAKVKDEAKENGSKLKPNGTSANGDSGANGNGTKADAKSEAKPDHPEVIVL